MAARAELTPSVQPAAFLDRDGVINFDRAYVHLQSDFEFIPGVFAAARKLRTLGYLLIVVTNQSGIGRGVYSVDDFRVLDDWMRARFLEEDAEVAATYYCPHHPTAALGPYRVYCQCRKPRPGMLFQAASDHGLALDHSLLVGDKASDLQAARAAGVPLRLLVGTDARSVPGDLPEPGLATSRYVSLAAAADALGRPAEAGACSR
jgi:D-glycero-D-manno-heptose 1,7-bisphosphate phosphatase